MTFKDIVRNDIKQTFINIEEFGGEHTVNGKIMPIIIDDNELVEREKRYKANDDGLYVKQVLFYVAKVDFGSLPAIGRTLTMDGKTYKVTDAINESGIYSISLEANKS